MHSEALNLTILLEEVAKRILSHVVREALDIKVAALLGGLVLDGLAEALSLTIRLLEGLLHVEPLVLGQSHAIDVVQSVQLGNSLCSTLGSILAISTVLRVVADEGEGALRVLHELHALNAAVLLKKTTHISLCEVVREVLGVNVVEDLAEVALVTRLVPDDLARVCTAVRFQGLHGTARFLETDKAVATRLMIRVKRNLERLDVTVLREVLLQVLRGHLLGYLAHEDVVVDDLLRVRAQQVVVEGEGAGGLALGELKVAKLLAGLVEFVLLWDGHDG